VGKEFLWPSNVWKIKVIWQYCFSKNKTNFLFFFLTKSQQGKGKLLFSFLGCVVGPYGASLSLGFVS